MGAANRWLKGSVLEDWRARHVDTLADRLMTEASSLFADRLRALMTWDAGNPATQTEPVRQTSA